MTPDQDLQLIPQSKLPELWSVSAMTIWRWKQKPAFPKSITMNGREYFRPVELNEYIEQQQSNETRDIPNADEGRAKGRAKAQSKKRKAA